MLKRIFALVLAVALVGMTMAGCGAADPKPSSSIPAETSAVPSETGDKALSGTLKFWGSQNDSWNESYQKMIDLFVLENPGVTIEYEAFPYSDYQSKVQTSLISGDGADIYELWGGWALDFTPTGALAKVPDALATDMRDNFYSSTIGAFALEDAYYGVPMEFNLEYGGMLANKKLFDQKGLKYPTTWDELEKVADQTSVRNGEIMEMRGFEFATTDAMPYIFLGMLMSKGGTYLSEDGHKVDFTSPEAVDAMTKLVDYVKNRNWTNLDGLSFGGPGHYKEVYLDSAMLALVGPWAVSLGPVKFNKTYGVDYDYVQLPKYGDKNAFASETGWGLAVSEKSKSKDLAWAFVEWFTKKENMIKHNIACSQIPARKSISEDPAYLESLPYIKPLLEILDGGQFIGYFNTDIFKESIYNVFTELVTTDTYASVADGLKVAQDKINALNP